MACTDSWNTDLWVTLGDFTVKTNKQTNKQNKTKQKTNKKYTKQNKQKQSLQGESVPNWKSIRWKRNVVCCKWSQLRVHCVTYVQNDFFEILSLLSKDVLVLLTKKKKKEKKEKKNITFAVNILPII